MVHIVFVLIYMACILVCVGVLFWLGRIVSLGKGDNLIAGYNTAPAHEKEKYDLKRLRKFVSRALYTAAFLVILSIPLPFLPQCCVTPAIIVIIVLWIAFVIVAITQGDRWTRKKR